MEMINTDTTLKPLTEEEQLIYLVDFLEERVEYYQNELDYYRGKLEEHRKNKEVDSNGEEQAKRI